jgi:hypothetical protein
LVRSHNADVRRTHEAISVGYLIEGERPSRVRSGRFRGVQAGAAIHARDKNAAPQVSRSAREAREKRVALALLLPSVLIPMLLMLSFVFGIVMTFTQWRLTTGFTGFNGLANYLGAWVTGHPTYDRLWF